MDIFTQMLCLLVDQLNKIAQLSSAKILVVSGEFSQTFFQVLDAIRLIGESILIKLVDQ